MVKNKWSLIGLFAILVMGVICVFSYHAWPVLRMSGDANAKQHYRAAIAYEQAGDWDKAIEEYETVLALSPDYKDAATRLESTRRRCLEMHYEQGILLMESTEVADLQRAVGELEIAYEIDPGYEDVAARLQMGRSLLSQALTPSPMPTEVPSPTDTLLLTDTSSIFEIRSFSAPPGTQPSGLAWDGNYLWLSSYMKNGGIYQINSWDGTVQKFCTPPVAQFAGYGGLAFDGSFLWVADAYGGGIYKLDTLDCSILASIPSPDKYPSDLAWDGTYLWVCGYPSNMIYKIEPDRGTVVDEFDIPMQFVNDQNWGLAFVGDSLWLSGNNGFVEIDPSNGQVLAYVESDYSRPQNLAWDGENLWVASFDQAAIYSLRLK